MPFVGKEVTIAAVLIPLEQEEEPAKTSVDKSPSAVFSFAENKLRSHHKSFPQEPWRLAEARLQDQWSQLEVLAATHKTQFQADMEAWRQAIEDTALQIEHAIQERNDEVLKQLEMVQITLQNQQQQMERDLQQTLQSLQNRVESVLFRQRQGWRAGLQSLQNWGLIILGVRMGFVVPRKNGMGRQLVLLSRGLQMAQLLQMVAQQMQGIRNWNPIVWQRTRLRVAAVSMGATAVVLMGVLATIILSSKEPSIGAKTMAMASSIFSNLMYHPWLPCATLYVAILESCLDLANRWKKLEQQQQQQQEHGKREDAGAEKNDPKTITPFPSMKVQVTSMATSMVLVALIQQLLPPWYYITAATTVTGSKLILDCLADEVVHNWMNMIRRIPKPQPADIIVGLERRLKLREKIMQNTYKMLERHLLHPAQAALTEIEMTLSTFYTTATARVGTTSNTTATTTTNTAATPDSSEANSSSIPSPSPSLGQKIKQVVVKSLRLRLTWSMAGIGMVWQWCWVKWNNDKGWDKKTVAGRKSNDGHGR